MRRRTDPIFMNEIDNVTFILFALPLTLSPDNNLDMEAATSHGKSAVNRAASISSASGLMERDSIELIL